MLDDALEAIQGLDNYTKEHRMEFYKPYDYQLAFHSAKGHGTNSPAKQRGLMAANQIGKTRSGAEETAMHLTGLYPEWWQGERFSHAVQCLVASNTNETTRDRCQGEMFGDPTDEKLLGTGSVPKHLIGEKVRKPGVPNAYDSILIKHTSGGWSKAYFRAYEQGPKKFMGYRNDVTWADEEPPLLIWTQMLRGTISTDGIIYVTFTPEEGMTQVVAGFINDLKEGQALIRATWDDAPHLTAELKDQKLQQLPEHERAMRARGEPLMGSGLVFPISEEILSVEPFEIPLHFARINGIDFGWDHPFACAFIAVDRDSDTVYIYDGYRKRQTLPPMHAAAIKARGDWIPTVWPHDGLNTDKQSGKPLRDVYSENGVNMHHQMFTNPPPVGEQEGKGGNSPEVGIIEMLTMMETGRFKVFTTVKPFWEEFRMYHRKSDGKIVALNDDFICAVRHAVMMRRHATTKSVRAPVQHISAGISNWGN